MTEEEKELMKHYGITLEQRCVYIYKDYKYAHLNDAMNYVKIDAARHDTGSDSPETGQAALRERLDV